MKTTALEKPRSVGTVSVKLDAADREKIASLAVMKKRTPHYLMKEAIVDYIRREEAQQNFIKVAEASFEHYKATGLYITLDEFSSWVDEVQLNPSARMPDSHV